LGVFDPVNKPRGIAQVKSAQIKSGKVKSDTARPAAMTR
jgi:hypothetical protein